MKTFRGRLKKLQEEGHLEENLRRKAFIEISKARDKTKRIGEHLRIIRQCCKSRRVEEEARSEKRTSAKQGGFGKSCYKLHTLNYND